MSFFKRFYFQTKELGSRDQCIIDVYAEILCLHFQVRSLLRMQECVSSDKEVHSFPLTPASTPVPSHENGENLSSKRSLQLQEKQCISPASDVKHESKQVTIGVNTGASLLWDKPQEECCECKRCACA